MRTLTSSQQVGHIFLFSSSHMVGDISDKILKRVSPENLI